MARVFLTDSFKNIAEDDLRSMIESVLQQLQDQINNGPSIASLVNPLDALPQGMESGDIIFNIQNGELRAGVFNGVSVLYASFGSFTGSITNAQHGDLAGGTLHSVATITTAGFMSAGDKSKLDKFKGSFVLAGPPSLTELPASGDWGFFTDTTGPIYSVSTNIAGVIKSSALT